MLNKGKFKDNVIPILLSVYNMNIFLDNTFDKITANYSVHHFTDNPNKALTECYRVLKAGGEIIISDAVPPHKNIKKEFERILALKEDRITFMENELADMVSNAGFEVNYLDILKIRTSLLNWLNNDKSLNDKSKKKIMDIHRDNTKFFKDCYNQQEVGEDILIDTTVAIIKGGKVG